MWLISMRLTNNGTIGLFDFQDGLKPGYLQDLPGKLKQFSDFLGGRKWFAGDNVRIRVCAA